jgi:tetratricopeptide (TPR) repeat protein
LTTWCEAQPGLLPFTGQCAVHRGQVMRVRGAYLAALEELERAAQRYETAEDLPPLGLVASERGQVLYIRRDLGAAEAAFDQAINFGHDPQPALALLWLAKGRTAAAVGAIRRLLAEPRDPVHRTHLLPGAIEILHAAGHLDEARPLVEELTAVAAAFGCSALTAMAGYAAGSVALAGGDPTTALPDLRKAMQLWAALDSPYEVARTRVLIGRALRDLGDNDSATAQFDAARRGFTDLGAIPAVQQIDRLLVRTAAPGGLTAREVEVQARGDGQEQPRNRRCPLPEQQDRCPASQQHLHQDRRAVPHGRSRLRPPARTGLIQTLGPRRPPRPWIRGVVGRSAPRAAAIR